MALILGIDPGSRITGYGVIQAEANHLRYIACGCLRLDGEDHTQRLKQVFRGISEVLDEFSPEQCAVEQVFLGKSVSSALKLGQARGSAMVACLNRDLPVAEYSARQIKQAVVGSGAAEKEQVQHMVKVLLKLSGKIQADAADALAIAICHANSSMGTGARLARSGRRGGRLQLKDLQAAGLIK